MIILDLHLHGHLQSLQYYYYYSEVLVTPTQSLQASKKFHVFLLGGENVMGGSVCGGGECVWGGGWESLSFLILEQGFEDR